MYWVVLRTWSFDTYMYVYRSRLWVLTRGVKIQVYIYMNVLDQYGVTYKQAIAGGRLIKHDTSGGSNGTYMGQ